MDTVHQLGGRLRGARVAKFVYVLNVNAHSVRKRNGMLEVDKSCVAEAKERGKEGKTGREVGVKMSLERRKRAWTLQSLRSASELRWKVVPGAGTHREPKALQLEVKLGRKQKRGGRRGKSCCWPTRVKQRGEGREEHSRSPCSLIRGQNID